MVSPWISVKIKVNTNKYLLEEVKETFLKHHPEFRGMTLSKDFLLMKAMRYYVER